MSLPRWLQTPYRTGTRATRLILCPRCGAPILAGLDADWCALTAHVDPTPITPAGEAVALLAGRRTYDLIGRGDERTLSLRETEHIQAPRRHPVVPAHACGQSLAAFIEKTTVLSKKPAPAIPPF
jgi:hypothetical protein